MKPAVTQKGSALESADTGEVAFVPLSGGAKRPITVVTTAPPPMDAPTVALSELVVHARSAEVPPPPPTEDSYKHITIIAPAKEQAAPPAEPAPLARAPEPVLPVAPLPEPAPPVHAAPPVPEIAPVPQFVPPAAPSPQVLPVVEAAPPERVLEATRELFAPEVNEAPEAPKQVRVTDLAAEAVPVPVSPAPPAALEAEDEPEFAVEIAPEARPVPETFTPAPPLSSTVVVVSPDRALTARLTREDLAEIERLVEGAVNRAIREQLRQRAQARTQQVQAAVPRLEPPQSNHRVAAVGAGLLLGGVASDLFVLNYDVWIRGEAANVVGWVQQLGLIGTAALAGAGAAAFVIGAAGARRRRRLARKVQVRARAHTPG